MESHDALVERVRRRDGAALAEFIDVNQGPLRRFIKSICSDRLLGVVELDDLLQEVSAAALHGLPTAPLEKYEPLDWLMQVARRRVVDAHRFHFEAQRRDAGRQQPIHTPPDASGGGVEALLAASQTSPSAALSRDARYARMQEAVRQLSEEQQAAIRLRYFEGLPTKEIAERLGKSDGAVRVLLWRSMRQLEKQLGDVRPTRP